GPGGTLTPAFAAAPDGVLDFVVDKSADTNFTSNVGPNLNANPALWKRKIRWYGLPRDDNGDGIAQGWYAGISTSSPPPTLIDVVPVRDVVRSCIYGGIAYTGFQGFPFEHFDPLPTAVTSGNIYPYINEKTLKKPGGTGDYANVSTGISPSQSTNGYST